MVLTDTNKLLGVTIDRHLSFDSHVQNVCKSAYYYIRALKHTRSSLSTDMARTIASALVNLQLNYANSVLYNTSSENMLKLLYKFRTHSPASLHTQNVQSIFTLYFINYTGFRSTTISITRWQHRRIKYGQRDVQHAIPTSISQGHALTRNLRTFSQYMLNVPAFKTQIARRAMLHHLFGTIYQLTFPNPSLSAVFEQQYVRTV